MTGRRVLQGSWQSGLRSTVAGARWPAILTGSAASVAAAAAQLERSQWLARPELEALQFAQLASLVEHAARHVPYYRERLADATGPGGMTRESWARVPVLERVEIQQRGDEMRSAVMPVLHGGTAESGTSGSTGRKILVAKSELSDLFFQALTLRAGEWGEWHPAGTLAAIKSYPLGVADYPEGMRHADWGTPYSRLCDSGPSFELNVSATSAQQAEWLSRVEPDYLTTYPSILPDLIEECRRRGVRLERLKQVRTIGECLDPAVRALCLEHWGVCIQDTYTAQETGYIALQCPEHGHYHVQSECVLVEVLDGQGIACAPGSTGRVVVTPLNNFAMPLLRYAIGDYAEVGPPCPCGRGLPVLNRIAGRARNMLVLPNGDRLWPRTGRLRYRDVLPVLQFQMIQTGRTTLELRLVVARRATAEDEARLTAMIAEWIGYPFAVTYTYVDEIPRGANGKYEDFKSAIGGTV